MRPDQLNEMATTRENQFEYLSYRQSVEFLNDYYKDKTWEMIMKKEEIEKSFHLQTLSQFVTRKMYKDSNFPSNSHYYITRYISNFGQFGNYFQERKFNLQAIKCPQPCGLVDTPIHRIAEECVHYRRIQEKFLENNENNKERLSSLYYKKYNEFGKLCYNLTKKRKELIG